MSRVGEHTTTSDRVTGAPKTSRDIDLRETLLLTVSNESMIGTLPMAPRPRKEYPQPIVLSDATVITGWGTHIDRGDTTELRQTIAQAITRAYGTSVPSAHLVVSEDPEWALRWFDGYFPHTPTRSR